MIDYPVRLQVYMAKSGCGSRRHCETLIEAGRVMVNMQRVTTLGTKVDEDDVVMVDGQTIEPVNRFFYFALNKPRGYVSTNYDPNEQNFARDLLDIPQKPLLFNVGRLDKDSSGLLLFTNDGELTQKLSLIPPMRWKRSTSSAPTDQSLEGIWKRCAGEYICPTTSLHIESTGLRYWVQNGPGSSLPRERTVKSESCSSTLITGSSS